MIAALRRHSGFSIAVGRTDCPEKGQGHQPQYLPLSRGQIADIDAGGGGLGRDNGVMVADLAVVADLGGQHLLRLLHAAEDGGDESQSGNIALHVLRQIAAVRPGVGAELFLIKFLKVVQGLLGGVAQSPVGLPLKGGEVVEGGGLFRLLLPLHFLGQQQRILTSISEGLCLCLIGNPLSGEGHPAAVQLHRVELCRLKGPNFRLTLDQQGQSG